MSDIAIKIEEDMEFVRENLMVGAGVDRIEYYIQQAFDRFIDNKLITDYRYFWWDDDQIRVAFVTVDDPTIIHHLVMVFNHLNVSSNHIADYDRAMRGI